MPVHNVQTADVQGIVQEVLRRLQERAQLQSGQSGQQGQQGQQGQEKQEKAISPEPTATSLVWPQSVVSAAGLQGRLGGVQQLIVGPKAIVTPAAQDELRERGIHLTRDTQVATTGSVTVAVQDSIVNPQTQKATRIDSDDQWLSFFTTTIREGRSSLAVSCQPYRLACFANRDRDVRAVAVTDIGQLEDAVGQAAANVLCVPPEVFGGTPLSVITHRYQQVAAAKGGTV